MITFEGRNSVIGKADRITRGVNSIYPHISESKSRLYIDRTLSLLPTESKKRMKLLNLKLKNSNKLDNLRYRGGYGIEQFHIIIENLKKYGIGNCYESAIMAQIIGKVNGLKNIYPARMLFTKNRSGMTQELDHAVAVVTDRPFEKDCEYQLKNKEAIIIDPWLGVTEFVGDYLNRVRNQFYKMFPLRLDDNYISIRRIQSESKNIEEFNHKRKELFKPDFYFKLHDDEVLSEKDAEILKDSYPELKLEKF